MAEAAVALEQDEQSSIEKREEIPPGWKPNIIAFACHYCAFAAADLRSATIGRRSMVEAVDGLMKRTDARRL